MSTKVTKEQMESLILAEFYFRGDEAALETLGASGEYIDSIAGRVDYMTAIEEDLMPEKVTVSIEQSLKLMTFCIIILKNGFKIDGMSACVDPANYNAVIGRQQARENALNKLWPILGYELCTKQNGDLSE